MHSGIRSFLVVLALAVAIASRGVWAQSPDAFEGWNLEPGVGQAHLVMVARVASISRVSVVEGAKTEVALREYRFQPVRILKGIFQRDQLSMTASDLGISAGDAFTSPPLQEGEFRLLILVQQRGITSYGCVAAAPGATTFQQRVPLLTGPDDPLVGVVKTLIKVADSRSRREQAKLLLERLMNVKGAAAVPLLTSLRLRADWAAADEVAYAPLEPWFGCGPAPGTLAVLAQDSSSAVRGAGVEVLRGILASGMKPEDPRQLEGLAKALCIVVESDEVSTDVRVASIEALGHLLALDAEIEWPRELLIEQMTAAATYAQRAAAATALAPAANPQAAAAVLEALAALPLDEPTKRESAYAGAATRLDRASAEKTLLARLKRSLQAGASLEAEVIALGRLNSKESLPLLLTAANQDSVATGDKRHIAWALGRLADNRAVPLLTGWLRGEGYQLKEVALAALEAIDSPVAAREVRPLVRSESHLPYKLRIARLLARHGLDDGYALATEHLADFEHTAAATLVLVALDDPRTASDLAAIVEAPPDRRWHAAALTGLAAIGDASARKQLLEILADDRHALVADAAEAVGLCADSELLVPLATLVHSRNKEIAMASLVALRRFFSGVRTSPQGLAAVEPEKTEPAPAAEVPETTRKKIAEAAASLALDAYVDADLRREALAVTRLVGGDRYAELLAELADQAELEGTPLLAQVQAERPRLRK